MRWVKVNLKKYINQDGKWRFVPVLKVSGKPRSEAVLIAGQPVKGTAGTFYIEWYDRKRVQKPCGPTPRDALDAWRTRFALLSGAIDHDETIRPIAS